MSAPQRAVAIAVAALVIVAAGVLALAFSDGRIGLAPDPSVAATPDVSATPSPSAESPPSADPTPSDQPADDDVLATITEIEAGMDDALRTIEETLPVPERYRPRLPRPGETWRDIEHGVDWVVDQLEPLGSKLDRMQPDGPQLRPSPGPEPGQPGQAPPPGTEPADDGWLDDAIEWIAFLWFLDWLSRKELTIELEIEGAAWTFERKEQDELQQWNKQTFRPAAGYAARLGDLMMHGDTIAPGLGSTNVKIGGKPALRSCDSHVCTKLTPLPHVGTGFVATQTKVKINGFPALRVGDYVNEVLHGLNPIVTGCFRVTIGPKPSPVECWAPGQTKPRHRVEPFGFRWRGGQVGHFKGKVVLGVDLGGPFVRAQGTVTAAKLWAEDTTTQDVPLGDIDGDGKVEAWRIKVQTKTTRALGVSDVNVELRPRSKPPVRGTLTPKPNETGLPKTTVKHELVEVEP